MIGDLISGLTHWMIEFISSYGWPAIFGLMFFGSATIPIPSWAVMPFGGFLVSNGFLSFPVLILSSTLGSLGGCLGAYALGYWGQETLVKGLIKKYGKYFFVSLRDLEKVEKWFAKKGSLVAFFSQLLPVVRAFAGLTGGLVQMPLLTFSLYSLAGILIWNLILGYLGYQLGSSWDSVRVYFDKYNQVVVIGAIVLAVFYLYHKFGKKKKKKA
ncbi:DedA family protein [Patescibacteria group bacterium]|nr:DedA family protein [Patescibacteria group bacterium]